VPAWPAVWQFHLKFSPKLANAMLGWVCELFDVPTTLNTCELKQGLADILVNLPKHKKLRNILGTRLGCKGTPREPPSAARAPSFVLLDGDRRSREGPFLDLCPLSCIYLVPSFPHLVFILRVCSASKGEEGEKRKEMNNSK
jgi:hypothetical protein